jgi:hypothetical protein
MLTRQLRVARRVLAGDAPYGPAWAATIEWVDELEQEIQGLGRALGLVVSMKVLERRIA